MRSTEHDSNRRTTQQQDARPSRPPLRKFLKTIDIDHIYDDPAQVRKIFLPEPLGLLAESLKETGMQQLPLVRASPARGKNRYTVITGARRVKAAKKAGLLSLECFVVDGALADDVIIEMQLVENLLREDLDPFEAADGMERLKKARKCNNRGLARILHVSDSTVTKMLALPTLDPTVQQKVGKGPGKIPVGTAYEVSRLPAGAQKPVAEQIVNAKFSREQAADEVNRQLGRGKTRSSRRAGAGGGTMLVPRRTFALPSENEVHVLAREPLSPNQVAADTCEAFVRALTSVPPEKERFNIGLLLLIFQYLAKDATALDPDMEDTTNAIGYLFAEWLRKVFARQDAVGDAARRAYHRLPKEATDAIGPVRRSRK